MLVNVFIAAPLPHLRFDWRNGRMGSLSAEVGGEERGKDAARYRSALRDSFLRDFQTVL